MTNVQPKLRDPPALPSGLCRDIRGSYQDPDDQDEIINGLAEHVAYLHGIGEHAAAAKTVAFNVRFFRDRARAMATLRRSDLFRSIPLRFLNAAVPPAIGLAIQWWAAQHGLHL